MPIVPNRLRRIAGSLTRACAAAPLCFLLIAARPFRPVEPFAPAAEAGRGDLAAIEEVLARRPAGLTTEQRTRVAAALVEECRHAGYDPLLGLAIIEVESDFRVAAVSSKDARGLMQFRPLTLTYVASREGVRLATDEIYRDPALTVRLGIRYLRHLERQFRDLDRALMAYNAGPGRLRLALHRGEAERFRGYARRVRAATARFRAHLGLSKSDALALLWAGPNWGRPRSAAVEMWTPARDL